MDFTCFHILYRMLTIYSKNFFFINESDFNIITVSMSTKRIYFTAYFNYHEICTYWMENVLKAPYNARNLYLLTNGYIHMHPKNELLFLHYVKHGIYWRISMLWMGFLNNLGIISISFDCRRCTYCALLNLMLFIASVYFLRIWNHNTEAIGTFASTLKWHLLLLLRDTVAIGNVWKYSYLYLLSVLMTKMLLCGKYVNVCLTWAFWKISLPNNAHFLIVTIPINI